jgi:hypothetical protein
MDARYGRAASKEAMINAVSAGVVASLIEIYFEVAIQSSERIEEENIVGKLR